MKREQLLEKIEGEFDNVNFTKKHTLEIFKGAFYGNLEINIDKDSIYIDNDINFNLDLPIKNIIDKKIIYGFIQYMLIKFDFSFTIEVWNWKTLEETFISFSK